jgi:hypothetical protein
MWPRRFDNRNGSGLSEITVLRLRLPPAFARPRNNLAREAGVGDRITFEQALAKDFSARGYDLVAFLIACTIWAIRWALEGT